MDSKTALKNALIRIKQDYENAIVDGGEVKKTSVIRSSKIINHIHEFIKQEFINNGISADKIYPQKSKKGPELTMTGFLKNKSQDITVIPSEPKSEKISDNSILIGKKDEIGFELTNKAITVNVRSQLSSLNKNFDTLFERTFAESLNLHLRADSIVLGEIYLVPLLEYNSDHAKKNVVKFENLLHSKYPIAFNALNNRKNIENSNYKYERVVLLVVDFQHDEPIIMTKGDLIDHGILNKKSAEYINSDLFDPFTLIPDLLEIYKKRHDDINVLKD